MLVLVIHLFFFRFLKIVYLRKRARELTSREEGNGGGGGQRETWTPR